MSLPCKVVEDLLPIYFDGLCSEETAASVEEHLKRCPGCSRMLTNLQTEFERTQGRVDDLKPLIALREKWQKNKKDNIKKGICAALAVVLLVAAVITGAWYFSYGRTFLNMAGSMEKTDADDLIAGDSDFQREKEGYRFDLWFPELLGDNGYARIMGENGLGIFVYPQKGGGYSWKLYIKDENGRSRLVYLKADLTPDFESHKTFLSAEKEKEAVRKLTAEKKEDIADMLTAAEKLWNINLLEYAK